MSILEEARREEEELYNRFQDSLEAYYTWEQEAQQEFLASIHPSNEDEED